MNESCHTYKSFSTVSPLLNLLFTITIENRFWRNVTKFPEAKSSSLLGWLNSGREQLMKFLKSQFGTKFAVYNDYRADLGKHLHSVRLLVRWVQIENNLQRFSEISFTVMLLGKCSSERNCENLYLLNLDAQTQFRSCPVCVCARVCVCV